MTNKEVRQELIALIYLLPKSDIEILSNKAIELANKTFLNTKNKLEKCNEELRHKKLNF